MSAMETKMMPKTLPKILANAKLKKLVVSVVIGAIAGFAVSFALMRTIQLGWFGDLNTSRSIAALAGVMYLLCGAFVGVGLLNPKMGAKFLNVEDAEELQEQSVMLRNSVFGIAAMGLSLILLAFAAPAGPVSATVAAVSVVVLMGLSVLTSRRQLRAMDELSTSVSRETAAMAFYLTITVGGGWSGAAHLGFVPGPAPLDWLTMFAALMLVAAFWVCGRRGLLTPR